MQGHHLGGRKTGQLQPPPPHLHPALDLEMPFWAGDRRRVAGATEDPSSHLGKLGSSARSLGEGELLKEKCPLSHPNHRFGGVRGQKTTYATVGRVSQRAPQPHLACLGPSPLPRAVLVLLRIKYQALDLRRRGERSAEPRLEARGLWAAESAD